ncbi:unnamed protein product [Polarella glacialis]|uniref:t-SNARE coiled-coil homology domain-containing protein n=1 Tax=Polarella glacialis TaxID=89957 RepID=A0A813LPR4_POLGL|nr:unnamed protein product [Polarella glacialis]CAE8735249.1 unnamed protein product [Polarella glacialis]
MSSAASAGQDSRQQQLLSCDRKLQGAKAKLQDSQRVALETEESGFQVLSDLARQREGIERISGHVQTVDDNISGARRLLVQMSRRATIKKVALWFMVLLLLITIVVVVYFLCFKPQ